MATQDTAFHRALCEVSGNKALLQAWEPLSRQLTIIFGLSSLQKPLETILTEHEELLATLKSGNFAEVNRAIEVHIVAQNYEVDFATLIASHRKSRAP